MANRMGGSQSKFTPEPQDVWYKMKLSGKHPKFLQTVMQAIADLKEANGSTQSRIIEYIQSQIDQKNIIPKPRNVTMQVKRALNHAVKHGLVKIRAGKFTLALNKKDFLIFKTFRSDEDPLSDCGRCSRRKKRRRKSRRGKSKGRKRTAPAGQRRYRPCPLEEPPMGYQRSRSRPYDDVPSTSSYDNFRRNLRNDPSNSYIN
ncbi:uncharacterized protein [Leptinotarsa decemlineata]|uniref:uncharacterized protein n=1 Tax=Leptinotarsa decemlineata TaxID=7539 RepID=UPI003D3075F7